MVALERRGSGERVGHSALLVGEFALWLTGRRLVASTTAQDYIRSIHHVARHAGVSPVEIHSHHLDAFLADPALSWHTKSLRLIAVRMWHRWGAGRGEWALEPDIIDTRLRHRPVSDPCALTLPQTMALLQAARSDLQRRLVYPGLFAGLRPGEIRDLCAARWVIGLSGSWELRVQGKQTSPPRKVPVHPVLCRLRDDMLSLMPSRKQLLRAARELRDAIDVPDFAPKWLRATFSQALRDVGVERAVIGALLGHSSLGVTTDSYTGVSRAEMAQALARLPYGNVTPFLKSGARWEQLRLF